MTEQAGGESGAPAPFTPRGTMPRRSGDVWVEGLNGERYWGRYGAAGLLLVRTTGSGVREALLQHRVSWSDHGGTWGLPGGAIDEHETPIEGALREAAEEAGVPAEAVLVRFTSVLDLGFWSYTTVVAEAIAPFEATISDVESQGLEWVALDVVPELPLHPGLAARWAELGARLAEAAER